MYQDSHTYRDAGFNGFFRRSIGSTPTVRSLGEMSTLPARVGGGLNYDQVQVSGHMGDTLQLGNVKINGYPGNITFEDEEYVRGIIGFPGGE